MIKNRLLSDFYGLIKTKDKRALRIAYNTDFYLTTLLEMFDYKNLPDTLEKRYLELFLLTRGYAFIGKVDGELYALRGTLAETPDAYGDGTRVIATTYNGKEIQGERDVDIVYIRNNDLTAKDNYLPWYAHIMSEIDLSIELNVLYSRYLPAPLVRDDKTKRAFDEYIDKIEQGEYRAILSDNILSDAMDVHETTLELTDPNKIDRVQYLSRLRDDINKTFYNRYGQALQTQNKSAQQTTDEVHGMDSASFIIPLNMLKCRKDAIEKVNRIFGTEIEVEFSEPWLFEYERYRRMNEQALLQPDGEIEVETGNDVEETGNDETETNKDVSETEISDRISDADTETIKDETETIKDETEN